MFKNILIVCVGNICRSPTAEALFAHRLSGQGLTISSAGIGALVVTPWTKPPMKYCRTTGWNFPPTVRARSTVTCCTRPT